MRVRRTGDGLPGQFEIAIRRNRAFGEELLLQGLDFLAQQELRETQAVESNLFEAARCVGDALREIHRRDGEALQQQELRVASVLKLIERRVGTAEGQAVKALPLLTGDPILIVNSDNIWTDGPQDSIANLARHWDDAKMDALLLVIRQASATGHGGKGDFHMDPTGKLSRRKPGRIAPFVYTGVQLVSRRLLVDAPEGPFSTNIFWDRAIAAGRLFGLSHMGQWFDVGTPASIATACTIPNASNALTDGSVNTSSEA